MHGYQRNPLEICAVVASRFHARQRELRCNVFGRKFRAARSRPAPLQQVERQKTHMCPYLFRINGCRGVTSSLRHSGNLRNEMVGRLQSVQYR